MCSCFALLIVIQTSVRPHCPLRRKRRLRPECCVLYLEINIGLIEELFKYTFFWRYIHCDFHCMALSFTIGISDHIACDCHFISFVMEGKTIDFKSNCFSGSACMKLSYLRSSGSTGAVNEIFPAHPPRGRCGCDGMKPCVAASDHVLMLRFADRHSDIRSTPLPSSEEKKTASRVLRSLFGNQYWID